MQPDRILSYASDGLTAALYRGRYAPPSNRIVIMLGGSDGSYALTQTYAAVFAENGLTALAVPYWGSHTWRRGWRKLPWKRWKPPCGGRRKWVFAKPACGVFPWVRNWPCWPPP